MNTAMDTEIRTKADSIVEKAFYLLERLATSDDAAGITELSVSLSLAKSNVHRLLAMLVELGYVEKSEEKGRYIAALKTWEVGSRVRSRHPLWRAAQSQMQWLHEETRETVYLTLAIGNELLYIDKREADYPIRASSLVGVRTPLYCTAAGKAMLAYMPETQINHICAGLVSHTDATITDPRRLREELTLIRKRGYAFSLGEWRSGLNGVGAPIRNINNDVVGAIAVSGPTERMGTETLERYALLVANACMRVSQGL